MYIFNERELKTMKEILPPNRKLVKGTPYCMGELKYILLKLWDQIISNRENGLGDRSDESEPIWNMVHKLKKLLQS